MKSLGELIKERTGRSMTEQELADRFFWLLYEVQLECGEKNVK